MTEFKDYCCNCKKSGSPTFARTYPIRRKGHPWKWICNNCWDEESKKT